MDLSDFKSRSNKGTAEEWIEKKKCTSDDKRKKRHYSSTSSNSESDLSKPKQKEFENESSKCHKYEDNKNISKSEREEWMNLQSPFYTTSNLDRIEDRALKKKQEREKSEYNPKECDRELNPYWKGGGDGLPKFEQPTEADYFHVDGNNSVNSQKHTNWKKLKKDPLCQIETDEKKKMVINDNQEKVSEKDLNLLAAKIVKAEIMGNINLVNELKIKLENAKNLLTADKLHNEEILLTHTDKQGRSIPMKACSSNTSSSHRRKKNIETHRDGNRIKYFADDDKYSLNQMFENEKYNCVEDINREFLTITKKQGKNDDLDDIFSDNIRKEESESKKDSKNKGKAISQHHQISKSLDMCYKCIQSEHMPKHLMVSMGETVYLCLPTYEPLTEGHCHIIPIRHCLSSTHLDENEYSEIFSIRRALVNMFQLNDKDVIFFECATGFHRFNHMVIECVPVPKEEGEMAQIYFKKAIDECETEWSHNKKLISLKGRDVRRAVPKGLPYFCVSFGMEEGYAHVIEDEQLFPQNFAQEIIGGMLDVHHSKWRKPKNQSFENQSKRVLDFTQHWANFDPTI